MTAFDKQKNITTMPKQKWFILDTQTGLFCSFYSIVLANCGWDVAFNAIDFGTEAAANSAIAQWGDQQGRFIGSNPTPH